MDNPLEASQLLATQRDAEANQHLLRGLASLEMNTPASLAEAVSCFDAAIKLRRQLPLATNPWFRYGLIAGWLNRGDALTRLGSTENLAAALTSYNEALLHLRELPMTESPLFVKRLAIAWLNRGITLLKQNNPDSLGQAAESFTEAITAAKNFSVLDPEEARPLFAAAWMNRSNALIQLQPPQVESSRTAAKRALTLCSSIEKNNAIAAEISFKARHVLCQALARLLTDENRVTATRDEFLAEATDAVDEGMALARHWETHGDPRFRAPAADLFRFGCRVYQTYQPHFLTEFLLENLDPTQSAGAFADDPQMHGSALNAIWHFLRDLQLDGFKAVNTPRFEKVLVQLRDLRITDDRLAELRRRGVA